MAPKVEEDYYYSDGGDDDDYYSTEEDYVCQSDGEYDGDDGQSSMDDEPDDDVDVVEAKDNDKGYDFETEDDVRRCQDEVTAMVSERLSVPRGFAAAFLRHCRWDSELLENEWFSDERRVRDAVGLAPGHAAPTALNDAPLTCAICFDGYAPGEMQSAGCAHFYCHECWRGYIHSAVGDGARCLLLRCPDPGCPAPVVRELVDAAAAAGDRARYAAFAVRSYVEEGTSRYVRWCPGPGCTLAVRSAPGAALLDVPCACGHAFCFRCGEDAHRPAPCATARAWADKCAADGDNTAWVLNNTKHCPKCRRAIEKNQGCNHMTCRDPCKHQFCWLCLGSWSEHARDYYNCNRYAEDMEEFSGDKARRRQGKASSERFLHYYERWTAHGASMAKARQELDELVAGGGLGAFAATVREVETKLDFLKEAYELVIEARRVLRWTYAHVYHLGGEHFIKLELYELIQAMAENSLELLHGCAEGERIELMKKLDAYKGALPAEDDAERFEKYKRKLCDLTRLTRNHFANLVQGFESGMAEVLL